MEEKSSKLLSNNTLKIIAAIAMVIDHVGHMFFPLISIFRIIGRIAFPIFAYMIAEGCKHTRHKFRYFLLMFIIGAFCQVVYFVTMHRIYMNILLTFCLSIIIIYVSYFVKHSIAVSKSAKNIALSIGMFVLLVVGTFFLTYYVRFDYGFFGVMLPVFASVFHSADNKNPSKLDNKWLSVATFSIGLLLLCLYSNILYCNYSFLAIPLLLCYSGNRGRLNLKYFFYIFYPVHLGVLYLIYMFIW
ncbi:MAG: hypothetical protein J6V40_04745 [Clostridia bacterium]|nr:hypothetical protein [Clostridia bacterium]